MKIKKSAIRNFGFVGFILFVGLYYMWEYQSKGSNFVRYQTLYGDDAKFLAWALLFLGIFAFFVCTYSFVKNTRNAKVKRGFAKQIYDAGAFLCPSCSEVFQGNQVKHNYLCPDCHTQVEELDGYYNFYKLLYDRSWAKYLDEGISVR